MRSHKFTIKHESQINLDVSYANKTIFNAHDTKFFELYVDCTLSWKLNTEQVLHRLSAACYPLRSIKSFMSQEVMKMAYYIYLHSTLSYGIIFLGKFHR
jgi:hypothetical protein